MSDKMTVRECMQRDVRIISRKYTVAAAARELTRQRVSSFLVEPLDQNDTYGIITRKDVVETLISDYSDENVLLVEDVMTHPVISIGPDLSVQLAQQTMRMVGVRRLPVIEDGRLVGILSNSDILAALVPTGDSSC